MNDAMDTCDLNSWSAERLWAVMRDAASAPDVRVRCLDQLAFDQAPGRVEKGRQLGRAPVGAAAKGFLNVDQQQGGFHGQRLR